MALLHPVLKVTDVDNKLKYNLLSQALFEPVSDLRRSDQFAKAEKKRIGDEVRNVPTSLDKESLPCGKISLSLLCLCMIGEVFRRSSAVFV